MCLTKSFSYHSEIGKIRMNFKVGKHIYPVKGLITAVGATLLLVSMAVDFSYGKIVIFRLEFRLLTITYSIFFQQI